MIKVEYIFIFVIGCCLGSALGTIVEAGCMSNAAVAHGAAHYVGGKFDSTTFEWNK